MIEVEKVNGRKIFINPDLVKAIEATPDTLITFLSGEQIILRTKPQEIIQRIIEFKKQLGTQLPPIKELDN